MERAKVHCVLFHERMLRPSFLSKRKMIQNIATHSLTHSVTLIKSLQQVAKKMFYRQFGQTQYTMPLTIFLVV